MWKTLSEIQPLLVIRDEAINHIISECCKLAQKEYKTRHDWVGKVIHWELCKKNEISSYEQTVYAQPKICPGKWDAQTPLGFWPKKDHLIPARQPYLEIINRNRELTELWTWLTTEPNREKTIEVEVRRACQGIKKILEHEGDGDTSSY